MTRALIWTLVAGFGLTVGACDARVRSSSPAPAPAVPADGVLAEFTGHFDVNGKLSFDRLVARQVGGSGIGVQRSALVDVPVTLSGGANCTGATSIDLDTIDSCRDGATCTGFSPCPSGYLCAGVRVRNCSGTTYHNLHLELISNSAPGTYTSANSSSARSYLGEGPGTLGLWGYGDLIPMATSDGNWIFNYPSVGEFTFQGVVRADPAACGASKTYCQGAAACVDLSSDVANCGTCGTTCSGGTPVCSSGTCVAACSGGALHMCGGACVDANTNASACGGSCTACSAGQYCSFGTCASCGGSLTACPSTTLAGGTQCVDLQSDSDNCGRCGTKCGTGSRFCSAGACITGCSAGTFSSAMDGINGCTPCTVGRYSGAGQNSCTDCGLGTYASTSGSASCTPCSPGTVNFATGQSSCVPCSAGTYQPSSGQITCLLCAPGTFQPALSSISCSACPAGYYQPSPGQMACLACSGTVGGGGTTCM